MTYAEIADTLGISKQAVARALAKGNPSYFQFISPKACVYTGLRKWMNANKVSMSELIRRCGLQAHPESVERYRNQLSGRTDLKKHMIDKILKVTGLTYEQAFGEASDG